MGAAAFHTLTNCQGHDHPPAAGKAASGHAASGHSGLAESIGRLVRLWRARTRERRAFVSFDDRDLRDTGMSRWELEHELSKPFWRG